MTERAVAYYRVSTARQGASGLGMEAQKAAVEALCRDRGWELVAPPFTEVESGKRDDRPVLRQALERAKLTGARLVIAKLDRLSRSAAFLTALQESGVKFTAADMPHADEFIVGIMAMLARKEREMISQRTTAALKVAKERAAAVGVGYKADGTPWKTGGRLGNPNGAAAFQRAGKGNGAACAQVSSDAQAFAEALRETVAGLTARGVTSLGGMASALNETNILTPRGGKWHASSVRNLMARLEPQDAQEDAA